jgi:hypothetical protein
VADLSCVPGVRIWREGWQRNGATSTPGTLRLLLGHSDAEEHFSKGAETVPHDHRYWLQLPCLALPSSQALRDTRVSINQSSSGQLKKVGDRNESKMSGWGLAEVRHLQMSYIREFGIGSLAPASSGSCDITCPNHALADSRRVCLKMHQRQGSLLLVASAMHGCGRSNHAILPAFDRSLPITVDRFASC